MVRFPCGSMSTHSTRWPFSAKAAARLSVVVVFATPPFWLANAMTLALGSASLRLRSRRLRYRERAGCGRRDPSKAYSYGRRESSARSVAGRRMLEHLRQAAGLRNRKGRRRQDDRGRRPRPRRRARGAADDRLRGGASGADVAGVPARGRGLRARRSCAPGLFAISIDPQRSMEEYLRDQVKPAPLARLLFDNRVFQYFAAAAPGHARAGDDRARSGSWPSSSGATRGHAVRPRDRGRPVHRPRPRRCCARRATFARRRARRADPPPGRPHRRRSCTDPKLTGVVAVALPEEMPVNETIDFERELRDEMGMKLDAVVVNALYPQRFTRRRGASGSSSAADSNGSPGVRAALRAALSEHRRAQRSARSCARLRRGARRPPVVTLPFLFEPELDLGSFEQLTRRAGAARCERRAAARGQARSASAPARAASARPPPPRRSRWAWPRAG